MLILSIQFLDGKKRQMLVKSHYQIAKIMSSLQGVAFYTTAFCEMYKSQKL